MPSELGVPLLLRQFAGIDQTTDAAFLDGSYLQETVNFHPDYAFLLQNRQGSLVIPAVSGLVAADMYYAKALRAYDQAGNPFLIVISVNAIAATVDPYLNDVTHKTGIFLATTGAGIMVDALQAGNRVYVCNGNDPMQYYDLAADTWTALTALTQTSLVGAGVAPNASTASLAELPSGSYTYCWAIYNTSTKKFVSRSDAQIVACNAGNYLTFTAPSVALGANQVYMLFVSPRGLPVEYGFSQTPAGLAASATYDCNSIQINDLRAPMQHSATRRGRNLRAHKSRIWLSGDETNSGLNASFVYGTNVLTPGLEQNIYDQDSFYPAYAQISVARNDGDQVTGHIPVAMREVTQSPSAPMAIFKNASTWLWFGDIIDDVNADLEQISRSVGCISHNSAVNTPFGVIFPSLESVWLLRADTAQLIELGRGIRNIIRSIPPSRRKYVHAIYHRGFYKLCYSPAGTTTNIAQLWLDLRFGLNPASPSWWGPHTGANWTSFSNAFRESDEVDRLLGSSISADIRHLDFHKLDQTNVYVEGPDATALPARLRTKAIDAGKPFMRKLFTRVRVNAQAGEDIVLSAQIRPDGGSLTAVSDIDIAGAGGAVWNVADWDSSSVGIDRFVEGETILGGSDARPRCKYAEFLFIHTTPTKLNLRDFEITFIPVDRDVASTPGAND